MKILNFGSLNIDYVYDVKHFVRPKETLASYGMKTYPGGKGLNQSIALAKAFAPTTHAGLIGKSDGTFLYNLLEWNKVDVSLIKQTDGPTGHAIIQVDCHGENSILLFGGANQQIDELYIDEVLHHFEKGDLLLIQNEISCLSYLMHRANEIGMTICFNPSPFNETISCLPLEKVSCFLMNEIEACDLCECENTDVLPELLTTKFPDTMIVLTLGEHGAMCLHNGQIYRQPIFPVPVIDTTAAGDTFTGFFVSAFSKQTDIKTALLEACAAAALAVSRKGAATSIPNYHEVTNFLAHHSTLQK